MKDRKICPKCKGKSIHYADRIYSGGGFGGKEYIGLGPRALGGMDSRFVAYVCKNCGYTELYLVKE